eukprot:8569874-Alexandrium_andersonii.AAC.1
MAAVGCHVLGYGVGGGFDRPRALGRAVGTLGLLVGAARWRALVGLVARDGWRPHVRTRPLAVRRGA